MRTAKGFRMYGRLFVWLLPLLLAMPLAAQDNSAPPSDQDNSAQQAPGDTTTQSTSQENPPSRAGRLSYMDGNVSFQAAGQDQWAAATLNSTVTTGDRLYTDTGARADVETGSLAVRMSETTDLTVTNLNDQLIQLGLAQGVIRVTITNVASGDSVEIDTPNGALTAQQPGSFRINVDPNNGTTVIVNTGSLDASGPSLSQTIGSGQAIQLTGTGPIQAASISMPAPDDFDTWSTSREQAASSSVSAQSQYVSPLMPGASDLNTAGTWQQSPDYGAVWYPSGVAVGWVPYRYGRWVWVEPWGWSWVENEPWGFAPFHYGRWAYVGTRWGWIPGPIAVRPVYCPALVAFVGGPGFSVGFGFGGIGVAAWFPLGPSEPFFPWYHYGGGYLHQVNVTNVRNVTNITNVANVNNIHYANRTLGTTAVPNNVFRSGQPVAAHAVKVTPEELSKATVVPHPEVNPTASAETGGSPVKAPPVRPTTLTTAPAGRAEAPGGTAANRSERPAPPVSRPEANAPPHTPPPASQRPTAAVNGTSAPSRNLVTRTPPPPAHIPFATRQQAMAQHPGRPLEPQQRENLRAGRPAGPQRDQEMPPHPARSAPPSHSSGGGKKP
jgi:hypothetical protein